MSLSKEELIQELKDLQNHENYDTRKIRAESLLLTFINDPEIDEAYMKIVYKEV